MAMVRSQIAACSFEEVVAEDQLEHGRPLGGELQIAAAEFQQTILSPYCAVGGGRGQSRDEVGQAGCRDRGQ
ncbi:hypothetical protein GCM10009789_66000 [Kribbella sancticallisti]|uniref:Uncharacterized protein n=1 Tax=Kribbella sancticallisti TaxID=460087 RepID=A0ABN2EEN2_9ACTN